MSGLGSALAKEIRAELDGAPSTSIDGSSFDEECETSFDNVVALEWWLMKNNPRARSLYQRAMRMALLHNGTEWLEGDFKAVGAPPQRPAGYRKPKQTRGTTPEQMGFRYDEAMVGGDQVAMSKLFGEYTLWVNTCGKYRPDTARNYANHIRKFILMPNVRLEKIIVWFDSQNPSLRKVYSGMLRLAVNSFVAFSSKADEVGVSEAEEASDGPIVPVAVQGKKRNRAASSL